MTQDPLEAQPLDAQIAAAALTHDFDELRGLLALGASPEAEVPGFGPLLLYAVRQGDIHLVETVINAGARVNRPDGTGETPLMRAASQGTPDIVEFLLERGAGSLAHNKDGRSALDLTRGAADRLALESEELGWTVEDVQVQYQRLGRAAKMLVDAEKLAHEQMHIASCHLGISNPMTVAKPLQFKPGGKP